MKLQQQQPNRKSFHFHLPDFHIISGTIELLKKNINELFNFEYRFTFISAFIQLSILSIDFISVYLFFFFFCIFFSLCIYIMYKFLKKKKTKNKTKTSEKNTNRSPFHIDHHSIYLKINYKNSFFLYISFVFTTDLFCLHLKMFVLSLLWARVYVFVLCLCVCVWSREQIERSDRWCEMECFVTAALFFSLS